MCQHLWNFRASKADNPAGNTADDKDVKYWSLLFAPAFYFRSPYNLIGGTLYPVLKLTIIRSIVKVEAGRPGLAH
jgi:hypothetical protein